MPLMRSQLLRTFWRPPVYLFAINTGDGQSATVLTSVSTNPKVRATNPDGTAAAGLQVLWTAQNDAVLNSTGILALGTTDASGYASITWSLSATAGSNILTATLAITGQVVTFTATGTASAATVIQANSFLDQSGTASTPVTTPPSIITVDANGNPKGGVAITWAVVLGGGSINTTGALTTDASTGIATLTSWTAGGSVGSNTVTATAAGLTGSPITFSANVTAAAPTQIDITAGAAQSSTIAGQAAALPISFRVRDGSNVAVQGVTVSFVTTGGTLSVPSAVTDASGIAQVTHTTAATLGSATITGTFAMTNGTLVSVATTSASTFGTATKLALTTQPSSTGTSGVALSQQPIVAAQDANSNTVTTKTGTVTSSVTSGNGTVSAGSSKALASGVATFTGFTLTDLDGGTNLVTFALAGLTSAVSTGSTLAPPVPVALLMVTQPSSTTLNSTINYSCRIVDGTSTTITSATDQCTSVLTTPGGATLSGTTQVNAVSGVASFSASVNTLGTYTITITSGSLAAAVSSSFTISAAGAFNEPGGMTPIYGSTGMSLGSSATGITFSTATLRDGSTYTSPAFTAGQTAVNAPGVPPSGDVNIREINFLLGEGPGTGSGQMYGNPNMSSLNARGIYYRFYLKMSNQWYGEATGTLKLGLPLIKSTGFSGVNARTIVSPHGAALADPLEIKCLFQSTVSPGTTSAQTSNISQRTAAKFHRDEWHLWEIYQKTNSAGTTDGLLKVWHDGTLIFNYTDREFDPALTTHLNWNIQSVYGGQSTSTPYIQYLWIGGPLYVSYHT